MSLLVSLKNEVTAKPARLPQAFRQIENWANTLGWQPAGYGSGWADTASSSVVSVASDPFGFVHVRGRATLTGTILNGASSNILTVLPSQVPQVDEVFGQTGLTVEIDQRSRTLKAVNNTGGTLTNPTVNLGGINWSSH